MRCSEQRTFAIYCQNLISRVYYLSVCLVFVLTLSCSTSLFVHHCVHLTHALLGLWIFHRLLGGGRLNAPPHDLGSWSP